MSLGLLTAGVFAKPRKEHDFYPTIERAPTLALLEAFGAEIPRHVWEIACGDGAMARVLVDYGWDVTATDLIDRGYGRGGVDFLQCRTLLAPAIATNPPFNLAPQFIRHAHALGVEWMAMLLKSQYWHAKTRLPLFREFPPNVHAPLTWRIDWTGEGRPTMECTWFIWSRARQGVDVIPLVEPETDLFA